MKALLSLPTRIRFARARFFPTALGALLLCLGVGCAPKEVPERERKEAAVWVSEAQFAMTMREWARAEGLLDRAVKVAPQGDYFLSLGAARLHLNNRSGAKAAYESALKAFEQEAVRKNTMPEPWIKQALVLGLLGRKNDSQAILAKAAKALPNDPKIRALNDPKELERMFSTPKFKEMAL